MKDKTEIDIANGNATPAQIEEIEHGDYITAKEFGSEFKFTRSYISKLLKEGRIKGIKAVGGQWRIARSELKRIRDEGCPPMPRRQKTERKPVHHISLGKKDEKQQPLQSESDKIEEWVWDDLGLTARRKG